MTWIDLDSCSVYCIRNASDRVANVKVWPIQLHMFVITSQEASKWVGVRMG